MYIVFNNVVLFIIPWYFVFKLNQNTLAQDNIFFPTYQYSNNEILFSIYVYKPYIKKTKYFNKHTITSTHFISIQTCHDKLWISIVSNREIQSNQLEGIKAMTNQNKQFCRT